MSKVDEIVYSDNLKHTQYVNSVAFSPDNTLIVSGSGYNKYNKGSDPKDKVRIWDVQSGELKATLEGHTNDVNSVAFSPNGTQIVSGSNDKTIRLWNVKSKEQIAILKGHTWVVNSVAFNHDGKYIVSGSDDETVRIWDVQSGELKATLEGHTDDVKTVAFSHNGTQIVSGGRDGTIRLWNVQSKEQKATLEGHTYGCVRSVAFSPDNTLIVSGSGNNRFTLGSDPRDIVRIWDVQSGELKATLIPDGHVFSVAFSPGGTHIVSGGRHICLWDIQLKKKIAILRGTHSYVSSVAFSPDGKYIVCGYNNHFDCFATERTVYLWDVGKYTYYNPDHVDQDKNMNTLGSQLPPDMNVELMKYLNTEDQYKLFNEANQSKINHTRVRYMKQLNLNIDEYRDMVAYLLRSNVGARNTQLLKKWVSTERSPLRNTKKKKQKKEKESSSEKSKSSGKKSRSRGVIRSPI